MCSYETYIVDYFSFSNFFGLGRSTKNGTNTSYFLSNLPQRYRLNPAYQPEYNAFVGLPALSGIGINYLNGSFAAEDFLVKRDDSVYMNVDKLYKQLRKHNFMMLNEELSVLSVGFRVKSWYATLDITQKADILFRFNKDIFTFLKYGNSDYPNMDFGKLGLNANAYLEAALGLSKKVNDKLTVGLRLKYLVGVANLHMTDSELGIKTRDDGTILMHSRQNIKLTAPVHILNDETGQPFAMDEPMNWDDIDFNTDGIGVSDILNTKNLGFAIDLGGEYQFSDRINFFASITDLGFIRWKNEEYTYNLQQDSEFEWKGADISGAISGNDNSMNDAFEDMVDSLKNDFRVHNVEAKYTTMLNTKIFLGTTYELNKMFNVGGVLRASFIDGMFFPALTASANARFIRNVSASVAYTMTRRSGANLGIGLTAKLGPLQLYLQTDNILAVNYTKTKAVNARFGINLLFGHKDKRNKVKENQGGGASVVPIAMK